METKLWQVACPDPETQRMYWYSWNLLTGESREFKEHSDIESEKAATVFAYNANLACAQ